MIDGVRDSKLLAPAKREELALLIGRQALAIGLGAASVREIAQLNVRRALRRIEPYDHALIDGLAIRGFDLGAHTTIVDGDARCYSIACAAIVAKVMRDRLMARLARRYPAYGWERNAGYGTSEHLKALREHGITPYHRRGFQPIRELLDQEG
jgi:ribonuclease HII